MKYTQLIIIPAIIALASCQSINNSVQNYEKDRQATINGKAREEVKTDIVGTWAKYWKETNNTYGDANYDHQNAFITIKKDNTFLLERYIIRSGEGLSQRKRIYSSGRVAIENSPDKKYPAEVVLYATEGFIPEGNAFIITIEKPVEGHLPIYVDKGQKEYWSEFNGKPGYPTVR